MSYAFRVYVGGKRYIIRKIKFLLTTLCLAVMVLSRNFLSILESRYSEFRWEHSDGLCMKKV